MIRSPWCDKLYSATGFPPQTISATFSSAHVHAQLQELLTQYGPLFEVWFDGANGGDGYYGGARETRRIDQRTYYRWEETWDLVRRLQPEVCMFSDAGPDIRWVGNEQGIAGDPCWHTLNRDEFIPGVADAALLNSGQHPGTHWLPAECDVSIRPGWFYHPHEDGQVRTPENLLGLYLDSVGRGASLLLNGWREFARGQGIGHRRLARGERTRAGRLRLRLSCTDTSPVLAELGVFLSS